MKRKKRLSRGATPTARGGVSQERTYSRLSLAWLLIAGLGIGFFLTSLLGQVQPDATVAAESKNSQSATDNQVIEPVFDFYTTLPEAGVGLTEALTAKHSIKQKDTQNKQKETKKASALDSTQINKADFSKHASSFDATPRLNIKQNVKSKVEKSKNNQNDWDNKMSGELSIFKDDKPSLALPEIMSKQISVSSEVERYYLLRAGSFKSSNDARKLLAQLLLLGLKPHIEEVEVKGDSWFRVQIGPIAKKTKAQQLAKVLADNHVESLIVRR